MPRLRPAGRRGSSRPRIDEALVGADTKCRMNAGFVKIHNLLCDHFVIYDGRVGAALELFVRQFRDRTASP